MIKSLRAICSVALLAAAMDASSTPLGTDFTYQGQLRLNGTPATGVFDLQFCLFAASGGGTTLGCAPIQDNVSVSEGRFAVRLDFGAVFDGEQKFAEIGVRDGASVGSFTALSPRQAITAAPYALRALTTAAPTLRRYYLTVGTVAGNAPLSACVAGYHMASYAEILDPSSLLYDTTLGTSTGDSGSGPPFSLVGWVRTGVGSSTTTQVGAGNCGVWTSNSAASNGTTVGLNPGWQNAPTNISPWDGLTSACNASRRVWCVQDLQ
jgi:hypothetical protein